MKPADIRSHVDHIVESQHSVGFHHAVDTVGHPVGPLCYPHSIGGSQSIASIWLASLVGSISHQHQAELFDRLYQRGDDVLEHTALAMASDS